MKYTISNPLTIEKPAVKPKSPPKRPKTDSIRFILLFQLHLIPLTGYLKPILRQILSVQPRLCIPEEHADNHKVRNVCDVVPKLQPE